MNTSTFRDRLWRKRLNELSAVWPDFVNGRTVGLHKTRVASRRIREALPIVGVSAKPAKVKKLTRKMRALTRRLGPIRELDVELTLLENPAKAEGVPGRAIEIVRREVASRRQALREELADKTPVGDLKKLLKKLERVAAANGRGKSSGARAAAKLEAEWRAVLAARLIRRARRVSRALENAGSLYVPERLHAVRISTKKLRYAIEIARDAGVAGAADLVRRLKRHQERLGDLHDLQMLLKRVREAEAAPNVGSRVNDLTAYADLLERECRRLHATFVDERAELAGIAKVVRTHIVPALTTPTRLQAHVAGARRTAARARAR